MRAGTTTERRQFYAVATWVVPGFAVLTGVRFLLAHGQLWFVALLCAAVPLCGGVLVVRFGRSAVTGLWPSGQPWSSPRTSPRRISPSGHLAGDALRPWRGADGLLLMPFRAVRGVAVGLVATVTMPLWFVGPRLVAAVLA